MSTPPALSTWLDLLCVLALSTSVAVTLAAVAARWFSSAVWQRTCWQIGIVALWMIVLGELSGGSGWFGNALMRLTSASSPTSIRETRASGHIPIGGASPSIAERIGFYETPLLLTRDARSGGALKDDGFLFNDLTGELYAAKKERAVNEKPPVAEFAGLWPGHATPNSGEFGYSADILPDHLADSHDPHRGALLYRPASTSTAVASRGAIALWPGWLWLVVSGGLAVRMILARARLWLYCRRAARGVDADLENEVDEIARRLRAGRVSVVELPGISSPVAFGLLRPTVGLPADFAGQFDHQQRLAVLAHEIAHLRGRDPAWQLASDITAAALWWQPLVWWLRGRLRTASEAAADEASVTSGAAPEVLAECLVQMGRRLSRPAKFGWLGFAEARFRSGLGRRVCRLLDCDPRTRRPASRLRLTAAFLFGPAVLLAGVLLCTAWARPQAAFTPGESTMTSLRHTWRQSLTAAALAALLAGGDAVAEDPPAAEQHNPAATSADDIVFNLLLEDDDEKGDREDERAERDDDEEAREHALRDDEDEDKDQDDGRAERRERAEREQAERREAEERGFAEHVERIEHEIRELLEVGREEAARELKARLGELIDQRRREQARRGEERQRDRAAAPEARAAEIKKEVERRIRHLHEAAANLREAGYGDQAEKLLNEAEQMARQLRERPDGPDREGRRDPRPRGEEPVTGVQQLREEVQQLRREIEQLRRMIREIAGRRESDRRREGEPERARDADREREVERDRPRERERDLEGDRRPEGEREREREPDADRERADVSLTQKAYYVGDVLEYTATKRGNQTEFDRVQPQFNALKKDIIANTPPEAWQGEGGDGIIREFPSNLTLVVAQTPDVHEKIAGYLDKLRSEPPTGRRLR